MNDQERVSAPGRYRGYASPAGDGVSRSSLYVTMSDGVRIAIDLFRPTRHGAPVDTPLPAIWTATPYRRAFLDGDELVHYLHPRRYPFMNEVCRHGYVVAVADIRGTGASFGSYEVTYAAQEVQDAVEIMAWLARQPWCDGKLGMFGRSYLGYHQFQAVLGGSPHLKAIFPCVCSFDSTQVIWPGGVYVKGFFEAWHATKKAFDHSPNTAPVDGDDGRLLLREAQRQHEANGYSLGIENSGFREDLDPSSLGITPPHGHHRTPIGALEALNTFAVPTYNLGGWFDYSPRDTAWLHNNLKAPRKLLMGPWHHGQQDGLDFAAEVLRWFDHWLKDVPNGIMDEPAVTYCVEDDQWKRTWRQADAWPLPEVPTQRLYLHDGALLAQEPPDSCISSRVIDYTATLGSASRWRAEISSPGPMMREDMSRLIAKGIAFASTPLAQDMEVVGHPIVMLQMSCDGGDFDCLAYLLELPADGTPRYLAEGVLRASKRATHEPPFNAIGLPFRRQCRADLEPCRPGEVVAMHFDLTPVGRVLRRCSCLCLLLAGGDGEIYETIQHRPAATLSLHSAPGGRSWIDVPMRPWKDAA